MAALFQGSHFYCVPDSRVLTMEEFSCSQGVAMKKLFKEIRQNGNVYRVRSL